MSRRIDIELTSARDDGTWTWRAAGAKQPRGVLDSGILYPGATAGDVVRAEADFEIDGITILSVIPPKQKRVEAERLEIIGPAREVAPVTSSLVSRRGRDGEGDRRPPRRTDGPDRDRGARPSRPPRDRAERPGGERRDRTERTGARAESRGPRPARPAPERAPAEPKPKEKRLNPGHVHRTAALEALAPEQRPIAEQVLRGGIPAVRAALEQEAAKAREEGRPDVNHDAILAMAEDLLPRLKAAEWYDRAEAAAKVIDDVSLRDLRAVVTGADAAARDDETRLLASTLREALEQRITKQHDDWVAEVTGCLEDGRLVRALRVAARPPDPGSRFPADLASRLSDAASAAMSPDITPDRWATLLDAVAASPVRRSVKPVGLPAEPGDALLQAARQQSGRVPALAAMLGIDMPPPPGPPPSRGGRPTTARPPRPPRSRPKGAPRVPPPPPAASSPAAAEPAATEAPSSEAAPAEPVASELVPTEVVSTEPVAAEPVPTEPVAAEPVPTEPVPTEPVAAPPAAAPAMAVEAEVAATDPSTQGAHAQPEQAEPTELGALASPDPAAESDAASAAIASDAQLPATADVPSPAAAAVEPGTPAEAVTAPLVPEPDPAKED